MYLNRKEIEYQKLNECITEEEKAEIRRKINNIQEDIAMAEYVVLSLIHFILISTLKVRCLYL